MGDERERAAWSARLEEALRGPAQSRATGSPGPAVEAQAKSEVWRCREACLEAPRAGLPAATAVFNAELAPGTVRRGALDALLAGRDVWALEFVHAGVQRETSWGRSVFLDALAAQVSWARVALEDWFGRRVEASCRKILAEFAEFAHDEARGVLDRFAATYAAREEARRTFPGYLDRMAWTAAVKRRRSEVKGASQQEANVPSGGVADAGSSPEDLAAAGELRTVLRSCVDTLTPDERRLLWARFGDEERLREIAQARGNTPQAVFSHIQRLLKRLGDCARARLRDPRRTP